MTTSKGTLAMALPALLVLVTGLTACGEDPDGTRTVADATTTVTVTAPAATTATTTGATTAATTAATSAATSADTGAPGQPPSTYAEAKARIDALMDPQGDAIPTFTTPSGNIFCSTGGVTAGCEITDGGVEDPSACPDDPMTDVVGRIEVRHGRVEPVCNTDTIRTPGASTLDYGYRVIGATIDCLSERIGVTCIDRSSEVGFFLARGRYLLLS